MTFIFNTQKSLWNFSDCFINKNFFMKYSKVNLKYPYILTAFDWVNKIMLINLFWFFFNENHKLNNFCTVLLFNYIFDYLNY